MSNDHILFVVRYLKPTDRQPTRLTATCGLGRGKVCYDYALSYEDNERIAIRTALRRLNLTATHTSINRVGRLPNAAGATDTVWTVARHEWTIRSRGN